MISLPRHFTSPVAMGHYEIAVSRQPSTSTAVGGRGGTISTHSVYVPTQVRARLVGSQQKLYKYR